MGRKGSNIPCNRASISRIIYSNVANSAAFKMQCYGYGFLVFLCDSARVLTFLLHPPRSYSPPHIKLRFSRNLFSTACVLKILWARPPPELSQHGVTFRNRRQPPSLLSLHHFILNPFIMSIIIALRIGKSCLGIIRRSINGNNNKSDVLRDIKSEGRG